jgi:pimeloyl-ACP methyl ester carboxylesterase
VDDTRSPAAVPGAGWRYGTDPDVLAGLLRRWTDSYNWRAVEAGINTYEHYVTEISGVPIHFVWVRSGDPDAIPLVLSHGWPWTFWDYRDVIRELQAPGAGGPVFDLVVPSLPGFPLSGDLPPGVNWITTASMWVELMQRLGYPRFAAAGGDFGAAITSQLGHAYADRVLFVHLFGGFPLSAWSNERPWDLFGPVPPEITGELRDRVLAWQARFASHIAVQTLDPQTLGYALTDSPAGLAAWLIERRRAWSDCDGDVTRAFSADDLLTSLSLYWFTASIASSMRFYFEAARSGWRPTWTSLPAISVPTGVSVFPADQHPAARGREWRTEYYNLVNLSEHTSGGHFAPAERPVEVAVDLRTTASRCRRSTR